MHASVLQVKGAMLFVQIHQIIHSKTGCSSPQAAGSITSMRPLFFFLFLFLLPALIFAQSGSRHVIRAGKLFNSLTGTFASGMVLVVEGSRITSVKKESGLTASEKGYPLIDLSKYAVLPGLIDAHTHLLYREEAGKEPGSNDKSPEFCSG